MTKTIQVEKRKRGIFGWIFLLIFWVFNAAMLTAVIVGMGGSAEHAATLSSEAEKAGAGIGMVLGLGMLLSVWVMGDIILGVLVLLTRGKKIITTEVVS